MRRDERTDYDFRSKKYKENRRIGSGITRASNIDVSYRVKRQKKISLKNIFMLCIFVTVLSFFVSHAIKTRFFIVNSNTVTIEETTYANRTIIVKTVNKYCDKNIIEFNARALSRELKKNLPQINEVLITKKLPNKVCISIVEYTAAALVKSGNKYMIMNEDGYVFHTQKNPVKNVPIIISHEKPKAELGKRIESKLFKTAISIILAAKHKNVDIESILFDQKQDICLNMRCKLPVIFGPGDEIDLKIEKLALLLQGMPSIVNDAEYVDITCPRAPVWKPKTASQAYLQKQVIW